MPKEIFTKANLKSESGQLLLEVLIAISLAAVVITIAANFIFVTLASNKAASEKNVALGLVDETLEAVHAFSNEQWANLYNLTHATADHHPIQASGKWASASGSDNVTLNNIIFTRSFRVFYVCRDSTTRDITGISDSNGSIETSCVTSGGIPDPSTQKIVATVAWNGNSVMLNDYFAGRFQNRGCNQTAWTTGSDNSSHSCASGGTPTSNYYDKCNIDITVSTEISLAQVCP